MRLAVRRVAFNFFPPSRCSLHDKIKLLKWSSQSSDSRLHLTARISMTEEEEYRGTWEPSWEKKRGGDRRWDRALSDERT